MSAKKSVPAEIVDPAEVLDAPPDKPRRGRRPIDLSTTAGVLEELSRVYRDARHGRLDVNRAAKLTFILNVALAEADDMDE